MSACHLGSTPYRLTYAAGADGGAVEAHEGVSYLALAVSNESYLSVAAFEEKLGI